jgi:hypothetical protein
MQAPGGLADTGRVMKRAALVALLALAVVGGASAGLPRNLTPPKLYGEFVAGRPVTLDPGNWTGAPAFQFFWERCTTDGSICKPAPDLGDEHATTVRPHGEQGYDIGVRLRAGVTVDHGRTWLWSPLSPVITAGGRPALLAKGGIDPYAQPRVGTLLRPYFKWGGSPRSVRYAWQHCGAVRCADIAGATRPAYRVRRADIGNRLRIISTATSGGGSSASASQTTKPVR